MSTSTRRTRCAAVALTAVLLTAGCGGSSGSSTTLVVDAAASLSTTFPGLAKQFEQAHPGTRVRFNFGGSDQLAAQIVAGAPVDVFAAASPATMAIARTAVTGAPASFARNSLEIAVPPRNRARIGSLADTTRRGVTLVLCAPTVPCGATALAAYRTAHLTPHPASQEENVTAVLTKVELDEADAGIVYRTDVRSAGTRVTGLPLGAAEQTTSYPIAVTRNGHAGALARSFVRFVLSAAAQSQLRAAGFLAP